jgi:hypothetical protein
MQTKTNTLQSAYKVLSDFYHQPVDTFTGMLDYEALITAYLITNEDIYVYYGNKTIPYEDNQETVAYFQSETAKVKDCLNSKIIDQEKLASIHSIDEYLSVVVEALMPKDDLPDQVAEYIESGIIQSFTGVNVMLFQDSKVMQAAHELSLNLLQLQTTLGRI